MKLFLLVLGLLAIGGCKSEPFGPCGYVDESEIYPCDDKGACALAEKEKLDLRMCHKGIIEVCREDKDRWCRRTDPGEGRRLECLSKNRGRLSRKCGVKVDNHFRNL